MLRRLHLISHSLLFWAVTLPFACFSIGCSSRSTPDASAELTVLTSSRPLQLLLQELLAPGIDGLQVRGLRGNAALQHQRSFTPGDLSSLGSASLLVWGGSAAEPDLARSLAALKAPTREFTWTDNVESKSTLSEASAHYWLQLDAASARIARLVEVLKTLTPEQAEALQSNADALQARLKNLRRAFHSELLAYRGAGVVSGHGAAAELLAALDIQHLASLGETGHTGLSARRIRELRALLSSGEARCILQDEAGSDAAFNAVVQGIDTRLVQFDVLGTHAESYTGLFAALLAGLKQCLQPASATPIAE